MRIGFDVRPLQSAHKGAGIGTYAYNLLKHLLVIGGEEDWLCYTRRGNTDTGNLQLPHEMPVGRPEDESRVALWEQVLLPIDIFRGHVDVFHATGGLTQVWDICAPRFQPARTIITVQDLHPLILPQFSFIAEARSYKWQMTAIRKAAGVIAVSENTKRDIIRLLGVPEEKITVIHMAPGEHFGVIEEEQRLECLRRHNLEQPFILYVGNYNVHKNIEAIVEAWDRTTPVIPLVIVGKRDSYPESLHNRIEALGRTDATHFVGGLSHDSPDLVALYNAATVFVFPSLYEGFGLPVVEAMRCGCPVIASRRGSLPEVLGEAGRLVEPDDVDRLAEEIQHIIDDNEWRESLKAKGFENDRRFSWKSTAEKTLALYQKVNRT
jgi:glycosyltransferase involved in cell wall biosynthesis